METFLEVRSLTAGYAAPIVQDISFTASPGELVAILGRNGSGKSTLLKGLSGSLPLIRGEVLVQGTPCAPLSPRMRARRMALLPQHVPAFPGLLAREVVEMGRYPWDGPLRPPGPHTRDLAYQVGRSLGIDHLLDQDCATLSQGQRQLVHLARILVQNAPVLLLDEPNSALDFPNTHQLFRTLSHLLGTGERCAVAVLHDPALALRWCRRLLLLDQGRLVDEFCPALTPPQEIQAKLSLLYPGIRVSAEPNSGHFLCTME